MTIRRTEKAIAAADAKVAPMSADDDYAGSFIDQRPFSGRAGKKFSRYYATRSRRSKPRCARGVQRSVQPLFSLLLI